MTNLTKETQENIKRIESLIDHSFTIKNGIPIPSWIELSLIDFCNRKCVFCPKGNNTIAPNQKDLYMHINLLHKIAKDLYDINFQGTIMLAGYGEPMLYPLIIDAIQILSQVSHVEMCTNGDLLSIKKINQMNNCGLSFLIVNIYDGPNQKISFKKMFNTTNFSKYILRDRWYNSEKDFGIKLTNRAGVINVGNQPTVNQNTECFYPHYSMTIDWNGDVLLCPQDWHRRIKCGNIAFNSIYDLWVSKTYKKYRKLLFKGERSIFPCSSCNCTGTLHGRKHAEKWHDNKH